MQALMISTFRQNKAILLSEISPTVFFNSDQLDSNHVKKLDEHIEDEAKEEKKFIPDGTHLTASQSEDSEEGWEAALNKFQADLQERRRSTDDLHREVLRAVKYDGWKRLEDRPAYLKSAFRTLTQSDLVERADRV